MEVDNDVKTIDYSRRRVNNQKFFEFRTSKLMESNLKYFIEQELRFYNSVVEQFTSRVKAFPQDIMGIKDRQIKLLETCAQQGMNPETLTTTKIDTWPEMFKPYQNIIFDNTGKCILTSKQIGIMGIGAGAGHLPSSVRRNIVSEAFAYVAGQASVLLAAQRTETLKTPLQMLQVQTTETKRHLQLNRSVITIEWNDEQKASFIKTPYGKEPLIIEEYDLAPAQFNSIIIRAPLKGQAKQKWSVEIKDGIKYLLNLTDPVPRKRRR